MTCRRGWSTAPQYRTRKLIMKLVNIQEVADLMCSSVSTIRRRISDARKGLSTFPQPIFGSKKKALWRQDDILTWNEALPDTPNVPYETPATKQRHLKIIHNELLEKYGINVAGKGRGGDTVTSGGDDV